MSMNEDDGGDGNENGNEDENLDNTNEEFDEHNPEEDPITIDGLPNILKLNMKNISIEDVGRYDFLELETAHQFYSWYSRMNGFSVRKSKLVRSVKGEKLQQTFVCFNEGYREANERTTPTPKREPRRQSRCGCLAKFRVHVNIHTGRWYVTLFVDEHNHRLIEDKYCSTLPGHRKFTEADISQIQNFKKVGIRTCQVYGAFANNSERYGKIGFRRKDQYNQVAKQRHQRSPDASTALKFLRDLETKDPMMFVRHTVDNEGRLKHLLWCDGESILNYKLFGEVVAFDATYRNIKYMCPFVVFSGVNHHNQTIIFATALVSNETEETYVWLLEQMMEAMEGKAPTSVITDDDLSMRNAIRNVFLELIIAYVHGICYAMQLAM